MSALAQQTQQALAAFAKAKDYFSQLVALLKEIGPSYELAVIEAGDVSAEVSILGWPYTLECHLIRDAQRGYETRISLLKPHPGIAPQERYSIQLDFLGNFGMGTNKETRMHHILGRSDVAELCRELVLMEAEGRG